MSAALSSHFACSFVATLVQDTALSLPDEPIGGDCLYAVASEIARFLRDPERGDSNFAPLFFEVLALPRKDLHRRGYAVDVVMPRTPVPFAPPAASAKSSATSVAKAGAGTDLKQPVPILKDDDWLCSKCHYGNDNVRGPDCGVGNGGVVWRLFASMLTAGKWILSAV